MARRGPEGAGGVTAAGATRTDGAVTAKPSQSTVAQELRVDGPRSDGAGMVRADARRRARATGASRSQEAACATVVVLGTPDCDVPNGDTRSGAHGAPRARRGADARGELGGDARGPARDAHRWRAFAWRGLASAAALLGVVGGCERVPEVTPADLAAVAPYVLDAAPPIPHPLDVRFGDKLQLLGYALRETAPVHAGQVLHLTLYWRCDAALGEPGWELFTHVLDAEGEPLAAADYEGPLRRFLDTRPVLWPSDWVAGRVYVDEQLVELPRRLKTSAVTLTEGVWRGRRLLPVVGGAKAEDGGAVLFRLPVEPLEPGARP